MQRLLVASAVSLLVLSLAPATARAERPADWLFRASPGFGYAWDRAARCPVEGRMFVGGWQVGKFVTESLLAGASVGVGFNALPEGDCPLDDSGLRMTFGLQIGPAIEWYPFSSGLHVTASAGYATYDQDSMLASRGAGGTIALGYDGKWFRFKSGEDARFGLALQASALRLTGHTTLMTALVMTIAVD